LSQYVEAKDIVKQLGSSGADPQSPTFVEDLLAEIETFGAQLAP